ncbi:SusC/RagA family TonB-linked outer membrane protein [Emticicia sp. BO119]|uniref:SusC/RagA family TonB-linked outer membrane protein n=1 Tax=Emticicia sp. BO119 TaxID=2757768 RepID=UPI0015F11753|nr:SusC/RagA family TonB-linked outer membrane protein [Emticicia sp. BO119]MBA4851166.1 SusC/RagA family TonB-linked outer membrane protein [Emticicia sp. BO119]
MKKTLLLSLLGVWLAIASMAQTRKITGKVTSSDDGSSLPGVSVQVKGTAKGTQTDVDGNYSIEATTGATLVFSFVGMNTYEEKVGNQSVLNVSLGGDTKQLSEVVVTAIGIQREKRALAYAVSNVKAEDLQQRSEPDALRALNGKVPGVNIIAGGGAPGQATRITIRGNNSFAGNNQPLFVVDGIPFDNSVNATDGFNQNTVTSNRAYDIDPNNVESLTVLKGAAASALYGSRAANGVVVITTKAGSKSAKKGLEVTYASSFSTEKISTIPDYQDTYTQGSNQTYNGGFIGNWGTVFPSEVDRVNQALGFERYSKVIDSNYPAGQVPHPLVGVAYGAARYTSVFPELLDANGKPVGVELKPHDIIGGFFRTGNVFENSLNISSTGDKTTISAGASRMTNKGIIPNSTASRTTLNFGGNAILANKITMSGNVNYVNTDQQSPQSGAGYYADYGGLSFGGSIYGRLFYQPRNYDLNGYPFENPVDGSNVYFRALDNPLWTAKYNLYNSTVNRVFGNMALNYDVTPWLNLTAKGGINTYAETRRNVFRPGGVSVPLGNVTRRDITNTEIDFTFLATATKDFGEKLNMRLMVGYNANQRAKNISYITGNTVIDPNLPIIGGTNAQFASEYREKRRLYGFFAEYTAGYNNILFLTATVRNDHSSTLPKENNSYLYPSVSASFIFTEAFKIPTNILSFGKLRANYAKVGKDADPYQVFTAYNLGATYYNASPISSESLPTTLNNAGLKPEFTAEVEVGAELQFFKNRIGLDIAYFDRTSTDLIVTARIPTSTGFDYKATNAGKIKNNGIEIGLNLVPIKLSNGFTWNSFVAFTRLRSEIVDAGPSGELFLGGTGLSSTGTMHRNGYPYGMIYGSKNARDDAGKLLISPINGLPILSPTSDILANPAPKFTVGWTNTFTYKGFTLTALMDYRHGGNMFSATAASLLLRGQLKNSEDREGMRVIPGVLGDPQTYKPLLDESGKEIRNTIPMTAFQYHFSSGFGAYGADETNIYDITTIRLREVSLGYVIPKAALKKVLPFFGSARISASGRNLWFKAPNMLEGLNFDPEVLSNFADSNVQGFDLGAAPSTRRYGVNLSVTF